MAPYHDDLYGNQEKLADEEKIPIYKRPPFIIGAALIAILLIVLLLYYFLGYRVKHRAPTTFYPEFQDAITVQFDPQGDRDERPVVIEEVYVEKDQVLYTYKERRPIPENPFGSIRITKDDDLEEREDDFQIEIDEAETEPVFAEVPKDKEEEIPEEIKPPVPQPYFAIKGIAGHETRRMVILEAGRDSFIVSKDDIIDRWKVAGVFPDRILLLDVEEGIEYELALGGEG